MPCYSFRSPRVTSGGVSSLSRSGRTFKARHGTHVSPGHLLDLWEQFLEAVNGRCGRDLVELVPLSESGLEGLDSRQEDRAELREDAAHLLASILSLQACQAVE